MLNSIQAAQGSHIFIYNDWEVETSGNPYSHAVLRGSVTHQGIQIPNYHYEDLVRIVASYKKRDLVNPGIIIDTNHSNSGKDFREQPRITREILMSRRSNADLKKVIKGLMIESYIVEGSQSHDGKEKVFGKSITDACLGWDDSFRLIMDVAEAL
jgi:3-deoxy-7-phosphoheptulonate synthase